MYVPVATVDRAVRLVSRLGEATDPDHFANLVLPELCGLIGCDSATYNEVGSDPRHVRYLDYPTRHLDPAVMPMFAALVHEHPVINHYRHSADLAPARISDFLDRRSFHRLALYAEFFRAIPVEHQLAVSIGPPGSMVIGLALNRSRRDFSEQDRAILGLLRAPLMNQLRRIEAARRSADTVALAEDVDLSRLTERETQVLDLVALGRTNAAIARALGVSPRTVAKHLEHAYAKLSVTSRAQAAVLAARSTRRG